MACLCTLLFAASCTDVAQARLARRILEDHRVRAKVKPLAAAQVVRIRLRSPAGDASGDARIEWDEGNYRETVSSAGLTTVRGIQAGKGYFTDEDGVTRLASEPSLSDLITRFYFWRRAYLFDDQADARLALGPADAETVSVRLTPRGGDPLLLTFHRRDLSLASARSRHIDLAFDGPARFRDASRRGAPTDGEIAWIGLPTGVLADTSAGGWSARWEAAPAQAAWTRSGRDLTFPARLDARPVILALDGAAEAPLKVRPSVADRLPVSFLRDVFGRRVARGIRLEIGGLAFPSLAVEESDDLPDGIDGVAGGVLLRETVLEIDPAGRLLRFYDPARWVAAQGYYRVLLDDDGNRAVAILRRKGEILRLVGPSPVGGPIALTPEVRSRLAASGEPLVSGLRWGTALPDLPALTTDGSESAFGEDGRLGWDLVLGFHAFFDMPHRWSYLQPAAIGETGSRPGDLRTGGLNRGESAPDVHRLAIAKVDHAAAGRTEHFRTHREQARFQAQDGVTVGAGHFHDLDRQSLVRGTAPSHRPAGGTLERHHVLLTHRSSSCCRPDTRSRSSDGSAGAASERLRPLRLPLWSASPATPANKKTPPVARRLAAAARKGLGAWPPAPTVDPRKIQTTASSRT
jgi:hypothetical protein